MCLFSSPALSRPPSALPPMTSELDKPVDMPPFTDGPQNENDMNSLNQSKDSAAVDEHLEDEQATLHNNEEESFALAPIDASALKGMILV